MIHANCPSCNASMPNLLGVMGTRCHLRCRQCGQTWNVPADDHFDDAPCDYDYD